MLVLFFHQEGDTESEPYDDEEFEGYEEKPDASPGKNKDPITIVNVSISFVSLSIWYFIA